MPKMYQHFVRNSMMKELFMTFIGATLSIVLTFGTAHYIDLREKKGVEREIVPQQSRFLEEYK